MKYRKIGDTYYIRIDKNEKVVESILDVCEKEKIYGGHIQGIGACSAVTISTYIKEKNDFIDHNIFGTIEIISLMGNISMDNNGKAFLHCHGSFSYLNDKGEVTVTAGHLKEAQIGYTGEIILVPAGEKIGRIFNSDAGIEIWDL